MLCHTPESSANFLKAVGNYIVPVDLPGSSLHGKHCGFKVPPPVKNMLVFFILQLNV